MPGFGMHMDIPKTAVRKFQIDNATLFRGDVLDVLARKIPAGSVDLIIADPPYNLGKLYGSLRERWPDDATYAAWCRSWLELCVDKLAPHGSMYLMASTQGMPALDLFLRTRLHVLSRIVWCYDSSGVQAKRRFGSLYEPILLCVKDRRHYTFDADAVRVEAPTGARRRLIDYRKPIPAPYSDSKVPGNVWYFPRVRYRMAEYRDHPTQKPEALLERMIRASSRPGDVVLDLFAGTFTASVVARRLGRRPVGVELQADYVSIGRQRLRSDADARA
jgi:site-specific DNA-methyltransferase (adenine-specific)